VLFTACGLARVTMAQVTPPLIPLMGIQLVSLVFFMLTPSLVLLLPNLIFGK
jgi:TRAP-type C4-dicarboxylate transport system permease large subunit